MQTGQNNYAFIDSQNLNLGIRAQGWELDFARFRVHLKDKYYVEKAFLCIGYVKGNEGLYKYLQEHGYICIFKPTLELPNGEVKGNVDAEVVLHTMIHINDFGKAVIVSGDGDFHCLVEHLLENDKLEALVVPNRKKYSGLLKRKDFLPYTRFVGDRRRMLERKERPL
ncbi:MAG: NYN domain-containing protein [Candidatus Zambryskibacteria bacterium]|nr:NYN domain-containing protein [Candidatus Zambryskibacteria bacterium]